MQNQFSRTELLIGKQALNKLKESSVIVFGLGGVGGYAVEALVRSGVGHIELVDSDKISLTNLNRQIYALHSTIGAYKTDIAKQRALDINPNIEVVVHNVFFTHENSDRFDFKKYDYVIDAIDTVSSKIELVLKANEANVPIISSMGAGNKMNPLMFETADIYKTSVCPLARVIRGELKKKGIKSLKVVYSKEYPLKPQGNVIDEIDSKKNPPASNAFVPSVAGLIIAANVISDLIKK